MKELEELREMVKLVKELDKLGVLHQTAEELKAQDLTPKNNNNKFTEDEKVILRNLPEEYKYIARNCHGNLRVYDNKPELRHGNCWSSAIYILDISTLPFNHIFQSIQWEDEEPCEFRKYL